MNKPHTLLYVTTTPIAMLAFFSAQLQHLRAQQFSVHMVTPPEPARLVEQAKQRSGAAHHPLVMAREISPKADVSALIGMVGVIAKVRPDIINFSTPKAALLAGIASVLLNVPLRVYFIHGLRSETAATGRLASLQPALRQIERLTCWCAHEVLCVSESNRQEAVALGLVPASKIQVLGAGSPAGIPTARYRFPQASAVAAARQELGLPEGTPVVGFVGRMVAQKGIEELLLAWQEVHAQVPAARLLIVGTPDPANPLSPAAEQAVQETPGVIQVAFEEDMSRLYPLMTLHTLPSRHEGLGMVVLEAAAAGVPSVLTDAPGVRDAGVANVTCLQVQPQNVPELRDAIVRLLTDQALKRRLAQQGQLWAEAQFAEEKVWRLWDDFYAQAWAKRQRQRAARRPWVLAGLASSVAFAVTCLRKGHKQC